MKTLSNANDLKPADELSNASNSLPDDNRAVVPPDPFSNSEVKRSIADGSVGFPHVRVGHCWAFNLKNPDQTDQGFFLFRF